MPRDFISPYPLPIPVNERTEAVDYIPGDNDFLFDKYGYGQRFWDIFSKLKITQGIKVGKRFGDEGVAPPWQKKFIISLFGHCDENGIRDFDESLLYCSKKMGKSSFSGPLAVAFVLAYPVLRGNVVILAATLKQSEIIYDSVAATIRADKSLEGMFQIRDYKKDVIHKKTNTRIQAIALEAGNTVGQITTAVFIDETHVCGLLSKAKQLIEQLISGQSTSENRFTLHTTTAPLKQSSGVFSSIYARAKRVVSGEAPHDRFMPIMFELPEGADQDDNSQWWRCCPSMDYTVPKTWLVEKHNTAKLDVDPTTLQNFYTQHLNMILGDTIGIDRYIPLSVWTQFTDKTITLERIKSESVEIYCGVDLGFRDDPSAIMIVGKMEDGSISCWSQQYLHIDGYNLRKAVVEYDKFIESGELVVSGDESYDTDAMTNLVISMEETGKLAAVGVDPMGLASWVKQMEESHPNIDIIGIPQGYKMSPILSSAERWIYSGKVRHQGLPMLNWNFENASLKTHGEAFALVKPDSVAKSPLKIDGAICFVECIAMIDDPEIGSKIDIDGMIG